MQKCQHKLQQHKSILTYHAFVYQLDLCSIDTLLLIPPSINDVTSPSVFNSDPTSKLLNEIVIKIRIEMYIQFVFLPNKIERSKHVWT